eukprot:g6134.t1
MAISYNGDNFRHWETQSSTITEDVVNAALPDCHRGYVMANKMRQALLGSKEDGEKDYTHLYPELYNDGGVPDDNKKQQLLSELGVQDVAQLERLIMKYYIGQGHGTNHGGGQTTVDLHAPRIRMDAAGDWKRKIREDWSWMCAVVCAFLDGKKDPRTECVAYSFAGEEAKMATVPVTDRQGKHWRGASFCWPKSKYHGGTDATYKHAIYSSVCLSRACNVIGHTSEEPPRPVLAPDDHCADKYPELLKTPQDCVLSKDQWTTTGADGKELPGSSPCPACGKNAGEKRTGRGVALIEKEAAYGGTCHNPLKDFACPQCRPCELSSEYEYPSDPAKRCPQCGVRDTWRKRRFKVLHLNDDDETTCRSRNPQQRYNCHEVESMPLCPCVLSKQEWEEPEVSCPECGVGKQGKRRRKVLDLRDETEEECKSHNPLESFDCTEVKGTRPCPCVLSKRKWEEPEASCPECGVGKQGKRRRKVLDLRDETEEECKNHNPLEPFDCTKVKGTPPCDCRLEDDAWDFAGLTPGEQCPVCGVGHEVMRKVKKKIKTPNDPGGSCPNPPRDFNCTAENGTQACESCRLSPTDWQEPEKACPDHCDGTGKKRVGYRRRVVKKKEQPGGSCDNPLKPFDCPPKPCRNCTFSEEWNFTGVKACPPCGVGDDIIRRASKMIDVPEEDGGTCEIETHLFNCSTQNHTPPCNCTLDHAWDFSDLTTEEQCPVCGVGDDAMRQVKKKIKIPSNPGGSCPNPPQDFNCRAENGTQACENCQLYTDRWQEPEVACPDCDRTGKIGKRRRVVKKKEEPGGNCDNPLKPFDCATELGERPCRPPPGSRNLRSVVETRNTTTVEEDESTWCGFSSLSMCLLVVGGSVVGCLLLVGAGVVGLIWRRRSGGGGAGAGGNMVILNMRAGGSHH